MYYLSYISKKIYIIISGGDYMTKLKKTEIIGFVFVVLVGSLLHFVYDLTGNNNFAALFSSVNESTWEHLKLLFFPSLIFAIAEYFIIGKKYEGFFCVKAFAIWLGMLTIVVLFYTYTGVIGQNFMIADISTFIAGAAVVSWYSYKKLPSSDGGNILGILLLAVTSVAFFVFTFFPPNIALFKNP